MASSISSAQPSFFFSGGAFSFHLSFFFFFFFFPRCVRNHHLRVKDRIVIFAQVQRCKVRIEEEKMPLGAGTLEGFKTTLVNEDIIPFKRFCKMWNEANLRPLGNSKAKASAHDKYPDVDKAGKWFFGKPIEQAEFSCDEAVRRYVPSLTTKYARYGPTHEQGLCSTR